MSEEFRRILKKHEKFQKSKKAKRYVEFRGSPKHSDKVRRSLMYSKEVQRSLKIHKSFEEY